MTVVKQTPSNQSTGMCKHTFLFILIRSSGTLSPELFNAVSVRPASARAVPLTKPCTVVNHNTKSILPLQNLSKMDAFATLTSKTRCCWLIFFSKWSDAHSERLQ